MRFGFLDALRGVAVIWMVIFHTAYDMRMLGLNTLDFSQGFWFAFPRVIAFTFLFCVGISLTFTHNPSINWKNLKIRSLKLGLAALIISISTFIMFPAQWIYFGTLHCILFGSLLGALFVNRPKWAWTLLFTLLSLQYGAGYDIKWVSSILKRESMDFIPLYPWFWAILLGIVLAPQLSKNRHVSQIKCPGFLKFLGTHSLMIYLIHQPIIYGTLWLIRSWI